MSHAYGIGDRLRLKGGAESATVIALEKLVSGEPAYLFDAYLSGSGASWVGETALEPAGLDAPVVEPPAPAPAAGSAPQESGKAKSMDAARKGA